jgi:hypothetical protein
MIGVGIIKALLLHGFQPGEEPKYAFDELGVIEDVRVSNPSAFARAHREVGFWARCVRGQINGMASLTAKITQYFQCFALRALSPAGPMSVYCRHPDGRRQILDEKSGMLATMPRRSFEPEGYDRSCDGKVGLCGCSERSRCATGTRRHQPGDRAQPRRSSLNIESPQRRITT